jgi:hypothetical protein
MGTVFSSYPTKEKTSVSLSDGTSSEYVPPPPVVPPLRVPFTRTLAPGSVLLVRLSVTVPVTVGMSSPSPASWA